MEQLKEVATDIGTRSLLVVLVVSALAIGSYATTATIFNSNIASQYGVSYNITGNLTGVDQGFTTTPGNSAASSQPCPWTNGGTCHMAMTRGFYRYSLLLTLNFPVRAPTSFTVLVQWDTGAGETTLGSLTFSVPTTAAAGQQMTFRFNTGANTLTSPLSMDITVA